MYKVICIVLLPLFVIIGPVSDSLSMTLSDMLVGITKPWKPRLWVPDPMDYPIEVHILSDKKFDKAAKEYKFNKSLSAFAVWGTDQDGNKVSKIFMRYHKTNLFYHELRHLQKGHFHD